MSIIRLRRIALLTQHLQVIVRGMPALAPRNNVKCLFPPKTLVDFSF